MIRRLRALRPPLFLQMAVISALVCAVMLCVVPTRLPGSQNPLSSPTTGSVSGLQATNSYNNALDSLNTCNSGASAPSNQLSGSPSLGNCWISTTSAPYPVYFHDGAGNWLLRGYIDPTNHLWVPPLGGGTGTMAANPTTDLGSVPQSVITVTGAGTITSFGSSAKLGTLKILVFSSSLTLGYNATSMILPTASNITTAAGDAAMALYLGSGNWQVVSYQSASGAALNPVPTGTVVAFAGSTPPSGFIPCDGRALSRTTFAALFAAIGTTWGAGDGFTTFNAPDLRGVVPAGADNIGGAPAGRMTSATRAGGWDGIGLYGGVETFTLAQAQLPAVGIGLSGTASFLGVQQTWNTNQATAINFPSVSVRNDLNNIGVISNTLQTGALSVTITPSGSIGGTTNALGSGAAISKIAPTATINYMIKTELYGHDNDNGLVALASVA
jgi:microcystin-dependent protein